MSTKPISVTDHAKERYAERIIGKAQDIQEQSETYQRLVQENNETIAEYKKVIHSLEEQNAGYQEVIQNLNANLFEAEQEVRETLGLLVGRKIF